MQPRVVLFADLAGFTALTETHGDEDAVELVEQLSQLIRAKLPPTASLVKIVGDAAMIVAGDAVEAFRLAVDLMAASDDLPGRPALRIGINTGELIERDGDYWGHTVNVAARVASEARPGEVLVTEAVQEQIVAKDSELAAQLVARGPHQLRNVSQPVNLFGRVGDDEEYHTDPVCRMRIREDESAGQLTVGGTLYHFCSVRCVRSFVEQVEREQT